MGRAMRLSAIARPGADLLREGRAGMRRSLATASNPTPGQGGGGGGGGKLVFLTALVAGGYAAGIAKSNQDPSFRTKFEQVPGAAPLLNATIGPASSVLPKPTPRKSTTATSTASGGPPRLEDVLSGKEKQLMDESREKATALKNAAVDKAREAVEKVEDIAGELVGAGKDLSQSVQQEISLHAGEIQEALNTVLGNKDQTSGDGDKEASPDQDSFAQSAKDIASENLAVAKVTLHNMANEMAESAEGAMADAAGVAEALRGKVEGHVAVAKETIHEAANEMAEKAEEILEKSGVDIDELKAKVQGAVAEMKQKAHEAQEAGEEQGAAAQEKVQEMVGVAMETAAKGADEFMVKAQEARDAAHEAAAEALSSVEESVNQAIFDAEELWKRFHAQEGLPQGFLETLEAKVSFLVGEAKRMAHVAHENEVRGRQELAQAVRETEEHVRSELGREITTLRRAAEEEMMAEKHLKEQLLAEQREKMQAATNEELLKQQKRLEELYELHYREKLQQQGEKQFEAGKTAFLLRLGRERTQRLAVLEKLFVQLKEVEELLDANSKHTSELRHINRLWVAKSLVESAYKNGKALSADRESILGEFPDPVMRAAIESLPDSFLLKGVPSYGQLQERFVTLRKEARKAAFLPDDGGGVLAHAAASLVSILTFERASAAKPVGDVAEDTSKPDEADKILARAEFWLGKGDLEKAAREVNQLSGLPRKTAQSWLDDARSRLEVEQALRLLDAHMSLSSLTMASDL